MFLIKVKHTISLDFVDKQPIFDCFCNPLGFAWIDYNTVTRLTNAPSNSRTNFYRGWLSNGSKSKQGGNEIEDNVTKPETRKTHWEDHLAKLVHVYNCTLYDVTGYSLFAVLHVVRSLSATACWSWSIEITKFVLFCLFARKCASSRSFFVVVFARYRTNLTPIGSKTIPVFFGSRIRFDMWRS